MKSLHRARFLPLELAALMLGVVLLGGFAPKSKPAPPNAMTSSFSSTYVPGDPSSPCSVFIDPWFKSGMVTLNGVVNPADSDSFIEGPNCNFYAWAEQMFLWLTSPAYGGGRTFDSPVFYDVSPPDSNGDRTLVAHKQGRIRDFAVRASQAGPHNLQIIFDAKGRMFEIEPPRLGPDGTQLILDDKGKEVEIGHIQFEGTGTNEDERNSTHKVSKPIFLDKSGKAILGFRPLIPEELQDAAVVQKFMVDKVPIFLDRFGNMIDVEQGQALDNAVLMAQNGSLVYYATMVNDVYAYFLTGTKTLPVHGGISPTPTKFPTTPIDLGNILAFAQAAPSPFTRATFPDEHALAVEVKTSWVEAAGLPNNASDYITMTATVPTYASNTTNETWTPVAPPNGQKTVLLAMVGCHVVGSVTGHPEMIWATFEHQSNMPNATYMYINSSGNNNALVQQSTAGNWLFCANHAAAPLLNEKHMSFLSPSIQANTVQGFKITPSNTIRRKAWGSPGNNASNNSDIISMNNSVRKQLISGDVRGNYMMIGAIWARPNHPPVPPHQIGTSKLENGTIETYQQGSDNTSSTGMNCFTCHNNAANTAIVTTDLSHVFWTPFTNPPHSSGLQPLF